MPPSPYVHRGPAIKQHRRDGWSHDGCSPGISDMNVTLPTISPASSILCGCTTIRRSTTKSSALSGRSSYNGTHRVCRQYPRPCLPKRIRHWYRSLPFGSVTPVVGVSLQHHLPTGGPALELIRPAPHGIPRIILSAPVPHAWSSRRRAWPLSHPSRGTRDHKQ